MGRRPIPRMLTRVLTAWHSTPASNKEPHMQILKRCAVLLALVASLSGCAARAKNITNLPAGVTLAQAQSWDTAVADLDKFANSVSALRQSVIALNAQGAFPAGAAYTHTLQDIGKADQIEIEASNFLKTVPQDWSSSTQSQIENYTAQIAAVLVDMVQNGVV